MQLSDAPHNIPTYIFDNHHHALRFWIYGVKTGVIAPGYTLIHIDEHSDLWHNPHTLDLDRALKDDTYAQEFTQYDCNVGNYIQPALDSGLIGSIIRVENEYQMDAILTSPIPEKSILNLDLDIFSPELAHIPRKKILDTISWVLAHVTFVTIATSPFFIDQHQALRALQDIWKHAKQ